MNKPTPEVDEVMKRLGHLEKQNRTFKKVAMLGIVIAGTALIMGQAASKTRIIEAQGFVLRDRNGFTRAELTTKPTGDVGLYLYNPNRFKAIKETVKAAGGEIKDPPDVSLELSSDGSPRLALGVITEANTELYVSPNGGAGLRIFSGWGHSTSLNISSDGSPVLSLSGSGKRSVRLGYSLKGEPFLYIADLDYKENPLKEKALV
jgi:hypothetical protein